MLWSLAPRNGRTAAHPCPAAAPNRRPPWRAPCTIRRALFPAFLAPCKHPVPVRKRSEPKQPERVRTGQCRRTDPPHRRARHHSCCRPMPTAQVCSSCSSGAPELKPCSNRPPGDRIWPAPARRRHRNRTPATAPPLVRPLANQSHPIEIQRS
jgi:hypothetical protein